MGNKRMDKFADIRPYNDDEITDVIASIIADDEFIAAVRWLKFPRLPALFNVLLFPLLRWVIRRQVRHVASVGDFQSRISDYMDHMIETTVSKLTISGLEKLEADKTYLFVSNHRDITLDPAFVNYAMYHQFGKTVRIAIGDNLLTKDFATKLMRLNKSFIVKRSEKTPKKMLAALKQLSEYIAFSLREDHHSVWIAQREGRAKDGCDRSDPAIIKMFAINEGRGEQFGAFIKSLNIVPVSISYEYDPCDQMKAAELHALATAGSYTKAEHEDIDSIARGIAGFKGNVHLSFGEVLQQEFDNADAVAGWIDKQIIDHYVLHPSNYFAYEKLYGEFPEGVYSSKRLPFNAPAMSREKKLFEERLAGVPAEQRDYLLKAYANPIVSKKEFALK